MKTSILLMLLVVWLCCLPAQATKTQRYIPGTFKQLWVRYRLANFPKGDPNYTKKRDRDNDGIACER